MSDITIKLIDDILQIFENQSQKGLLVFVVGRSGAGKTTLGENFKKTHNWLHFDCDQWAYGQDPLHDSGKTIAPQSLKNRSKELIDAYDNLAVKNGYQALFKGENPPLSVWKPYYTLLAKEILKVRSKYNDKNMICSQSVYPYCVREYLRSVLCPELIFIVLNTPTELLTKRIIDRDTKSAAGRGWTLKEYIDSFPGDYTIEKYKNEIAVRFIGFEQMQKNEPKTFQIDVDENMTTDEVLHATEK
eukprot:UN05135